MSLAEELQKLADLHRAGTLTDDEFARAKALLLNGTVPAVVPEPSASGKLIRSLHTFTRSSTDYWIGGVCGGLGEHTGVPSWCWRVLFFFLLLGYGIGLLPYLALWICVPTDAARTTPYEDRAPDPRWTEHHS
jgi:phage shock protein PspC (stress-responsive transcriptional regulator)